ncbi:hypothetical protein G9A89_021615 [Geosiphon pyriformis]|nr:hypothetical protein G9A89_021615 [Geosiphon pyriformis]
MKNVAIDERQTLCLIIKELNGLSQQNYVEDASSIIESTKHYHFPYSPSLSTEHPQKYIKVATIGTIGKDHSSYGKALFQYFQKDLEIPVGTTYIETITETLHIIDTDIKYYVAQRFPQVQQPVESDSEEYENKSNNPVTAQAKPTVNKKPRALSPTTPSYHQTPQSIIVFNPPLETHWTKSLGEYGLLFGNLTPAAGQTEGNLSTWEQPPAQNLAELASPLMEKTAILQPIGSSNKGKQPALAPGEHSNMRTPIPLNITKDNAYSWIADAKKAITANVQALLFFLTGTANSWYQSLAEKPTSFTEFKLAFLQYFCNSNMLIRLQNQFSIIKQKDHEAVTTYLGRFNQILHQILAIKRDYYTMVQVLNQFIKGLQSSILRSVRPCHPTSLQDAVTFTRNFEPAKQEANHTQVINLVINGTSDINTKIIQLSEKLTQKIERFLVGTTGTYQPLQQRENNNNSRYPQQQNCQHIARDCRRKIMDQNQGNSYQQSRYQQNIIPQYSIPQNQLPLYAQQVPYTQPPPQNYYQPPPITQAISHYQTSPYSPSRLRVQTNSGPSQPISRGPAQSQPTPTGYPNQASYLGLMEDQDFDKFTPVKGGNIERISQSSKQTKSNILPATITEDTTLAAIFSFDIDNLNTHSLFSEAVINQDKPIMALYTDARVGKIDIKLILDSGSAGSIITKQLMDQLGRRVDHAATTQIITADGNTKTSIEEIDNFLFEINGIQIPIKVLIIEATQYQALIGNNWLSKANATLDWNT